MDLVLQLHDSLPSSIVWCGKSGRKLGKLSPSGSATVDVSLLPLAPGLHVSTFLQLVHPSFGMSHWAASYLLLADRLRHSARRLLSEANVRAWWRHADLRLRQLWSCELRRDVITVIAVLLTWLRLDRLSPPHSSQTMNWYVSKSLSSWRTRNKLGLLNSSLWVSYKFSVCFIWYGRICWNSHGFDKEADMIMCIVYVKQARDKLVLLYQYYWKVLVQ